MSSLPIELYYRTKTSDGSSNAVTINNVTNPLAYNALSVRFMMTKDKVPNKDIIQFNGIRTPEKIIPDGYSIYSLYNETFTIQTKTGIIQGTAIYNDPGLGFESQVKKIEYGVTSATGEFTGATITTIFIDNVNFTRRVLIQ